jgi:VWFA-related protein
MRGVLSLLLASSLLAQNTPTFSSSTQLVVETVIVRDKDGKVVPNLKREDFILTEDQAVQDIKFFEFQALAEPAPIAVNLKPNPLARLPRTQIAGEPKQEVRYRDRRLLALYFDMSAMMPADQIRVLDAARKFVRTQMTSEDLVALMQYTGGAVQVLQDFTADRQRLLDILETLVVGEEENATVSANDASSADTGAAFGQNDAEFNVFFTDRQLAALQTAAQMLGRLSERKSLLYFSSGLRLNGTNNQAQLNATINAAVRAGVSFWPIDARGLVASAPLGNATQASPGGQAMYSGASANAMQANFQRSQDTLWSLAADTGGKALLDSNDLGRGMVEAQKSFTSYYVLGYYTTNTNPDGKFRKIEIKLKDQQNYTLEYRKGYYAQKIFTQQSGADKERQLEDALLLGDPITDLTLALEVSYFQLNRAEYFVPVAVKIPGRELTLARKRGADHTVIDFIGEVKDNFGVTISNVRDKVDIKLSGATAAQLAARPIEYDTGFTLLPGKYKLKLLARDLVTGRIGTFETRFTVPNLARETKKLPASSVVLSSQKTKLNGMLFNAAKDKGKALAANPLVSNGEKLSPSVTRVFSKSKKLYVYWELYPGPETPVLTYLSFFRDNEKTFDSPPLQVAQPTAAKLRTLPLRQEISLDNFPPGEYRVQLNAVDASGQKAAFWETPILVIP